MTSDSLTDLARELHQAFYGEPGVFGKTRQHTPEYVATRHVRPPDKLNFLTITATMDYQTDAERLWQAARDTYLDSSTSWLFDMKASASASLEDVKRAMTVHGFTGRFPNNNVRYVHRVCQTFVARYGGSPYGLLEAYSLDALVLYRKKKRLGDLPSLTGNKIFPFWLRMLQDIVEIELQNIHKVPLPVDVHTARATYRLVYSQTPSPE